MAVLFVFILLTLMLVATACEYRCFNRSFNIYPNDDRANRCIRFLYKAKKDYQKWVEQENIKGHKELRNLFLLVDYLVFYPIKDKNYDVLYKIQPVLNQYVKEANELRLLWEDLSDEYGYQKIDSRIIINRTRYVLNEICHNMIERTNDPKLIGFPLERTIA